MVREKLIRTAADLFYKKGYAQTGINEILKESGTAKASLYHHFNSKEELGVAWLKKMEDRMMREIRRRMDDAGNAQERLLSIFNYLEDSGTDGEFRGCWAQRAFMQLHPDEELLRREVREQKDRLMDFLKSLFEDTLQLTEGEVQHAVRRTYLYFEFAILESHLNNDRWPIQVAKVEFMKLLRSLDKT